MPFGYTTFSTGTSNCFDGIDILVEPADGTAAAVLSRVNATTATFGTNTGETIKKVAADPNMTPGSFIVLITDGEPNCPDPPSANDPDYTVAQIKAAADAKVRTFVIGFGALPSADQMAMNQMADAGGVPCTDTTCNGKHFYAAESDSSLNAAFDQIFASIVGEFNALCDDSCYANGCPDGDICVQAACKPDPCASLATLCAPGDYCFTDGTSAAVCAHPCPLCATGESCTSGVCTPDPCATASCVKGQICQNGACVNDPCAKVTCDPNYLCKNGQCVDDPCHFVQCPTGTSCVAGTGQCMGALPASTRAAARAHTGCAFADGGQVAAPSLVLIFMLLARRRRAAQRRPPC
jgi:hypothetical protein